MAKSGRNITIIERRLRAAQLKRRALSYRTIARMLTEEGYPCTRGTVQNDLKAYQAEMKKEQDEEVEKLRRWEIDICNDMIQSVYDKAADGDVTAQNQVYKWQGRRAEFQGTMTPIKIEDVNPDTKLQVEFVQAEDGD